MRAKKGFAGALAIVSLFLSASAAPPEVEILLPHAVVFCRHFDLFLGVDIPITSVGFGDFSGDGIPDLVTAQPTLVEVLLGEEGGEFGPRLFSRYASPEGSRVTPLGGNLQDLDDDEDLDIMVATLSGEGYGEVHIFLNTGQHSLVLASSIRTPLRPDLVWVQDVSGDGILDLVAVDMVEGAVQVSLGEGKWNFQPVAVVYRLSGKAFHLRDVTGDGKEDLLFFTPQEVRAALGDGAVGFTGERTLFSLAEGMIDHALAVDLDGDGVEEIVLSTSGGVILLYLEKTGFDERGRVKTGFRPGVLLSGDFDGDGVLDLLVADVQRYEFTILPGDGVGGLLPPVSPHRFPFPWPTILEVGDLDGNGKDDLILGRDRFLFVYLNGICGGTSRVSLPGRQLFSLGDLDGDGDVDLLVPENNGITVLWNNGSGGLVPHRVLEKFPVPGPGATVVEGAGGRVEVVEEGEEVYRLLHLDPVHAAAMPGKLFVFLQRIEVDRRRRERVVGELRVFDPAGEPMAAFRLENVALPYIGVGDLDGDGVAEAVMLSPREFLVFWQGERLVRYPWDKGELSLFRVGAEALWFISVGEYAELYRVEFHNDVPVILGPFLQLAAVPLALAVGDLDGDGREDPVALCVRLDADRVGDGVRVSIAEELVALFLSQRNREVEVEVKGFPEEDAPWFMQGLAIGEFTGDGILDIAYSTVRGTGIHILAGNGAGGFSPQVTIPVPAGPLFSADLDGNGIAELLASTVGGDPFLFLIWNKGES